MDVVGQQVHHFLSMRIGGREADGFAYRTLGPLGIAPTHLRQAANVGGGVIDLFAGEGFLVAGLLGLVVLLRVLVAARLVALRLAGHAADLHRRRRPQVGARCHGGEMAGVEDVGAGAGRPRAAGGDEAGYRHRAGEDRLDDAAHGGIEAAGRVDLQHHQLRLVFLGTLDAPGQVVGGGRADGTVHRQHRNAAGGQQGSGRQQGQAQEPAQQTVDHGGLPLCRVHLQHS
ncbi:hypothetical protein D9M71_463320 [compost metagenome]